MRTVKAMLVLAALLLSPLPLAAGEPYGQWFAQLCRSYGVESRDCLAAFRSCTDTGHVPRKIKGDWQHKTTGGWEYVWRVKCGKRGDLLDDSIARVIKCSACPINCPIDMD